MPKEHSVAGPFSRAELRGLAGTALGTVRAQYAQLAQSAEVDRSAEAAFAVALETLGAVAYLAAMRRDASFVPDLVSWASLDPEGAEDGDSATEHFFAGLSAALAKAQLPTLARVAAHEDQRVRVAVARVLDPSAPAQRQLLEQLARDPQYAVSHAARERSHWEIPWQVAVFGQGTWPADVDDTATLDQLDRAFRIEPVASADRDAALVAIVPKLPDAAAVPLILHRLRQQVRPDRPVPSELIRDLGRRSGAAGTLFAAIVEQLDADDGPMVPGELDGWMKAAPAQVRRDVCQRMADCLIEGRAARYDACARAFAELLGAHWPRDVDPGPLWWAWLGFERGCRPGSLLRAVAECPRTARLQRDIVDAFLELGLPQLTELVTKIYGDLSPSDAEQLVERALESPHDRVVALALEWQAAALATADPEVCRARARELLAHPRLGAVMRATPELAELALPELRGELLAGRLDWPQARALMIAIGSVHGGLAQHAWRAAGEAAQRTRRRQQRGSWIVSDAGAASDAEWGAFRKVRDGARANGEVALDTLPAGPWHPDDLAAIDAELDRLLHAHRDPKRRQRAALYVWQALSLEPSGEAVVRLRRLRAAIESAEGHASRFLRTQLDDALRTIERQPPSAAPRKPAPELDWMDQEEADE